MPRPPASTERDWYTTPEVADLFQVTTATVRTWIKQGDLGTRKVNGYNRVPKTEVRRYAAERFGLQEES